MWVFSGVETQVCSSVLSGTGLTQDSGLGNALLMVTISEQEHSRLT